MCEKMQVQQIFKRRKRVNWAKTGVLQAEASACAKALRSEGARCSRGTKRTSMWPKVKGLKNEAGEAESQVLLRILVNVS